MVSHDMALPRRAKLEKAGFQPATISLGFDTDYSDLAYLS